MSEAAPDTFPAVVIGSGFGGSVAAYRLQQECEKRGESVLLLERGMPYPPRSFPRTPREMGRNFWDPESSLFGLYEVWRFQHSTVLVSSGLGGGSLIYANVLIRKPSASFTSPGAGGEGEPWPIDYERIAAGYENVEDVIGTERLPDAYFDPRGGAAMVPKTRQFLEAAAHAGKEGSLADLAVTFAGEHGAEPGAPIEGENLHGRRRRTCTLVGECDLGCNEGAKNTLDYNYLSRFSDKNGKIRTCCEVVEIMDCGNEGYEVRYLQRIPARERVLARARSEGSSEYDERLVDPGGERLSARVRAKVVVLAAGALGSTRLLLASRAGLAPLSPQLGRRFSSNGDLLLFARDCLDGDSGRQRDLAPSRGPVITAYATDGAGARELWLEDAGGPNLSEWAWQLPETPRDTLQTVWAKRAQLLRRALLRQRPSSRVSADLAGTFGTARASSAMLPMLAMGYDRAGGRMRLDRDALTLDWNPADSAEHFDRAQKAAAEVAEQLGGRLWPECQRLKDGFRGLTVHPLGGCTMGARPNDGVVDPNGEVFGCPGLFVCDGSVMPGPVGPNPSFTIAALADHIADTAVERLSPGPRPKP
jgi:cholesterol oxidase